MLRPPFIALLVSEFDRDLPAWCDLHGEEADQTRLGRGRGGNRQREGFKVEK